MRVLVAHASAHGSTRGIAEHIADRLSLALSVDCFDVDDVGDIEDYDAVVIGSAIHSQAWLPAADRFVRAGAEVLAARPVWLFSVGMPGALAPRLRSWAMQEGPKVVAAYDALVHPRDARLFSGVVRRGQFPPVSRAIFRSMGGRYGDFRDWADIDYWVDGIAADLSVMQPTRGGVS